MTKRMQKFWLAICSFLFLISTMFCMLTLNVAKAAAESFKMVSGASVRVVEPYGIMFKASVPETQAQDANKKYYMMIIPEDYITTYSLTIGGAYCDYYDVLVKAVGEKGVATMQCLPYQEEGEWRVRGSLVGVQYENLNRNFVGIAYYEENGKRTYADLGTEYTRSISNVASRFVNSDKWAGSDTNVKSFVNTLMAQAYDNALGNEKGTTAELPAIDFNYDEVTLLNNENTLQLTSNYVWDIQMDWVSADKNVVTVDEDGNLTAVGGGTTTVTTKVLGEEKSVTVTVKDIPQAFKNIYIDPVFSAQNKSYYSVHSGYATLEYAGNAYLQTVNAYNRGANTFAIDTGVLATALKEGLTTLSVDVKLVAEEGYLEEVPFLWATAGNVIYNSGTTTVTTEEWTTMTLDLTVPAQWNDASKKAFVVNGDTVTVNCSSVGLTSPDNLQGSKYKALFTNFRMETTGSAISGMYVNSDGTKTFNLYSNNKASIVENGTTKKTFENCKAYGNGAVKFFNGTGFNAEFNSNDYAVVNNGEITLDGTAYKALVVKESDKNIFIDPVLTDNSSKYSVYSTSNTEISYVFESTYDRPAYLHYVKDPGNRTANRFSVNMEMVKNALLNGFTTISVDVKLVNEPGLLTSDNLFWQTTGNSSNTTTAKTVTTNEWVTLTVDLTTIKHWTSPNTPAFEVNGDSVTVNCDTLDISSNTQSGQRKILFSNFRVGEQTQTLSGMYMNTSDVSGDTFGREKIAFYSTGEAVFANGTSATAYEYKYYQDGTVKICADADNYLSLLAGETVKLTGNNLSYAGDTYTALNFTPNANNTYYGTVAYNDTYVANVQPAVTYTGSSIGQETHLRLVLDNAIVDAALSAGYTKVNIYAKSSTTEAVKIVLNGSDLWKSQGVGRVEINNETYTLFTIDLKDVKGSNTTATNGKVCVSEDPNNAGSYVRNWDTISIAQETLVQTTIYYADYYFSK